MRFPRAIALFGLYFTLAQFAMKAWYIGQKPYVKKKNHENFHRKKNLRFPRAIALFGLCFTMARLAMKAWYTGHKNYMIFFNGKQKTCDFPPVITLFGFRFMFAQLAIKTWKSHCTFWIVFYAGTVCDESVIYWTQTLHEKRNSWKCLVENKTLAVFRFSLRFLFVFYACPACDKNVTYWAKIIINFTSKKTCGFPPVIALFELRFMLA